MSREILRATEDDSVNIIEKTSDNGYLEARLVQRYSDEISLYVSSQFGCDLSCRFCHLTQMGQTMNTNVNRQGYLSQIDSLLTLAKEENRLLGVETAHVNFMARGDILANDQFVLHATEILRDIIDFVRSYNLQPKIKLSTIFPKPSLFVDSPDGLYDWVHRLLSIHPDVEFYYSLYSLKPEFRKRWIPKALDPEQVGEIFASTQNRVRLHHALIRGANDTLDDVNLIHEWLHRHEIETRLNIVRYNPYSEAQGEESSADVMLDYCDAFIESPHVSLVNVIDRVGMSVKASCGTFVS